MTQLFKKNPSIDILNKVLGTIGIYEFKEEFCFKKSDLISLTTVSKMNEIIPELTEYYYPCKAKLYLTNIDTTKCITIIRQFLRYFDYSLVGKEKYSCGEKFIIYTLVSEHTMKIKKNTIIEFTQ